MNAHRHAGSDGGIESPIPSPIPLSLSHYGKIRLLLPMLAHAHEIEQALALGVFVRKLNFLSIGTNDLIQYTPVIDRTDDSVSHLYDPLHPAVLHLIAHTIKTGARVKVPLAVCGEMAGDITLTQQLLGFGLRQFSMHPANLLAIKQQALGSDSGKWTQLAKRILQAEELDQARELLEKLNA